MDILQLGWTGSFAAPGGKPIARVIAQERELYQVMNESGRHRARAAGRLRRDLPGKHEWPVVGDWVVLREPPAGSEAVIEACLPRRTALVRKVAGDRSEGQVLAANVDYVFLVASLASPLNLNRIERHLTALWNTGATPLLVLSKADLCPHEEAAVTGLTARVPGVQVVVTSARSSRGVDDLREALAPHRTGVFLGPSGVGKSSLANALLGHEVLETQPVREGDQKGRHTTTRRELLVVPAGGVLIDTPGLREYQLWEGDTGAFADIEEFAARCRFRDCQHLAEPGCAVLAARQTGELDGERLDSYHKLQRELIRIEARKDDSVRRAQKEKLRQWMKVYRDVKQRRKHRDGA